MKGYYFIIIAMAVLACSKPQEDKPVKDDNLVKDSLTILSYNIHHGAPTGNTAPINLDDIAAVIRDLDPDLVALQEVDKNTIRAGVDQAKVLAGKLGMQYYFSKSINYNSGEFGVAILSKYPIVSTERLVLSNKTAGGEQRTLGVVLVDIPNLGLHKFASAHLDLVLENREAQVTEINEYSAKSAYPLIIAGDLNTTRYTKEFAPLKKEFLLSCQASCPLTFPADHPIKEIDFILMNNAAAKKLSVGDYKAIKTLASDHLPLLGVFTFYRDK